MHRLYIVGLVILLTAILANLGGSALGLMTWYDFLNLISEEGGEGLRDVRFIDYVWLLLLYPLALGLGHWLGFKLAKKLFG